MTDKPKRRTLMDRIKERMTPAPENTQRMVPLQNPYGGTYTRYVTPEKRDSVMDKFAQSNEGQRFQTPAGKLPAAKLTSRWKKHGGTGETKAAQAHREKKQASTAKAKADPPRKSKMPPITIAKKKDEKRLTPPITYKGERITDKWGG